MYNGSPRESVEGLQVVHHGQVELAHRLLGVRAQQCGLQEVNQRNQDLRPPEQDSKMAKGEAPREQVEDCVSLLLGVHTTELGP